MKGRKAWGLLAYLLLTPAPSSRERLAALLFSGADDPLGAVRWNLAELRRALRLPETLKGRQVGLELPPGAVVDVNVLNSGTWTEAIALRGLGRDLLEGMSFASEPAFETWLMVERARLAAVASSVAHEAAAAHLGSGRPELAARHAAQLVALDPYDEVGHELLIRSYVALGQPAQARDALDRCTRLFREDLATEPGPGLRSALNAPRVGGARHVPPTPASAVAELELGEAAIKAGATDTGLESLRAAVAIATDAGDESLEAEALLALGYALVHSVRGRDGEASSLLHRALAIAQRTERSDFEGAASRELGYIEMLVARYERALSWLDRALALSSDDVQGRAWTLAYQAICYSDTGRHGEALIRLNLCLDVAPQPEIPNQTAYAFCLLGRLQLLRGDLTGARTSLKTSLDLAQRYGWSSILPWPEALLADVELLEGKDATPRLERALSLARRIGDPCWEGAAMRGLGIVAAGEDHVDQAVEHLLEASRLCVKFPDGYLWMQGYSLDALCDIGSRARLSETTRWIHDLESLSARTGMRELLVRAHVYRARLGDTDAAVAAHSLVAEVDNPVLVAQVEENFQT
ncbi:MAG TPA: tetratricopeptide repeat protein [Actinomycetota bacterium]|nr:tetratricopeptide repeat protein [Actinomycetota bacterium]